MFNQAFIRLAEKIIGEDAEISTREALTLAHADPQDAPDLIACAGKIRQHFKKNGIFKCAIINAKSGMCPEDCAFCAQSAHHRTRVTVYDLLSPEKLEAEGLKAAAGGATHYSIVTSGTALTDTDLDTRCCR